MKTRIYAAPVVKGLKTSDSEVLGRSPRCLVPTSDFILSRYCHYVKKRRKQYSFTLHFDQ